MNFISKIFGKKAPSAAEVGDRIAAAEAERDAGLARQASGKAKLADLALLTEEEHAAAEKAQEEGRRAAERAKAQIVQLRAAQAEAEAREEREAFDRDVAEHKREVAEVSMRIEREYPELAGKLGPLLRALHECEHRGDVLEHRGRKLGASYQPRRPEAFRRAGPQMWRGTWPNPDEQIGGRITAGVEDAPRGTFNWINGEPVPAREGVTVKARPRQFPTGLLAAITHLPGLHWGDPDFWRKPSEH